MWKDYILFFGQANKKDDKINELYAQFMILEEAEEIRAVIGYEQSGGRCTYSFLFIHTSCG